MSTAEIATPIMACSTHSNHKHLPRAATMFCLVTRCQMVTRVGLELKTSFASRLRFGGRDLRQRQIPGVCIN
eukprot:5841892-Pyramimonas_sp.AAC.1